MKVFTVDGKAYRLPNALNAFQQEMYIHLIKWKWDHITADAGMDGGIEYDAILPDSCADKHPILYSGIKNALLAHLQRFPFRIHKYFSHMASSQAANVNLFLPILLNPNASAILRTVKPDVVDVAPEQWDNGFRIEFWDEPFGMLGDKTDVSGTDSDIAIAYRNQASELCLWLVEHKLTEAEFTACGGAKSKARQSGHDCNKSFSEILKNKGACYYHDVKQYNYWRITEANADFFANHDPNAPCPFRGGMNQLWRNQLLAMSIEQDDRQPFKHVFFSVVKHPGNKYLDRTLKAYRNLIGNNKKFSVFTSDEIIRAAEQHGGVEAAQWAAWYRDLYKL